MPVRPCDHGVIAAGWLGLVLAHKDVCITPLVHAQPPIGQAPLTEQGKPMPRDATLVGTGG